MKKIILNKYLSLVFTLVLSLTSCEQEVKEGIETINVNINQYDEIQWNDFFSMSKVVTLETNSQSVFSRINRISLYNNKIFILDRKMDAVFVFKETGEYLFKINSIGKGPHEYNSLMDFTIDKNNNEIILYTDRPYALYVYNLKGQFNRKIKLDDLYFGISSLGDNAVLLNKKSKKNYLLFKYDMLNSNVEEGIVKMNDKDISYKRNSIGSSYLNRDKNIHLTLPYSDLIYEYNENGIEAKYFIDFGSQKLPDNIYKQYKDFGGLFKYAKENNLGYGICDFRENKDYITFNCQLNKLVIFSKKTKKARVVKLIKNNNMFYGSYIAHDGNDNKFISVSYAERFKKQMLIYKNKADVWKKVPNHIKQIDENISENDNPILVIDTFKE